MLVDGMVGLPTPEDLAFYLGYDDPTTIEVESVLAEVVRKAPERRLPALALAIVAPGAEDNLADSGNRWDFSPTFARRWLGFLSRAGHELTEAETNLIPDARKGLGDSETERDA
jgi:hypothetical protein